MSRKPVEPLGRPPELHEVWHGTRSKIQVEPDGCWTWCGKTTRGYGPYRRLYVRYVGPVPAGMDLHHACYQGPAACVNPAHLKLMPSSAHRASHQREFTGQQLEQIRRLAADPDLTLTDIAKLLGVPRTTINNIVQGKRYSEFNMKTHPQRDCLVCGIRVVDRRRNAKFCSPEHRIAYNNSPETRRRRKAGST